MHLRIILVQKVEMNTPRSAAAVLVELSLVEAQSRQLARRRAALIAEATQAGATQDEVARRVGRSQATLSRQLNREPQADPMEEAVDAYEAGQLSAAALVEQLLGNEGKTMPALDRAFARGTIGPDIVSRLERRRGEGVNERERLELMDPDLLGDVLRASVQDAVAHLRRAGDTSGLREQLARRGRATRAKDSAARVDLILECRAILDGRRTVPSIE